MIKKESHMTLSVHKCKLFLTVHKCKMLNYNINFKTYNKNSKVKNYHQIFIIPSEIVQYYIKFYHKTTHQKLFNTTSDFTKRLHIRFTTYTTIRLYQKTMNLLDMLPPAYTSVWHNHLTITFATSWFSTSSFCFSRSALFLIAFTIFEILVCSGISV